MDKICQMSDQYFDDDPTLCHYSYLYIIWNLITGKGYGGQTIEYNVRMYKHAQGDDNCTYLNRSIAKHGWENFKPVIVEQGWFTQAERDEKEIALIAKHGFFGGGYNLTKGGAGTSGHKWTEEQRAAVSGKNNHKFGTKTTPDTIAKQSAAKKGKKNPMFGRKKSVAAVAATASCHLKPVLGKRKHENQYIEFESGKAAAKHFKCCKATVSRTCNGGYSKNFDFKFK